MQLPGNEFLSKLADISADLGTVFMASIVLPVILDKFEISFLVGGAVVAILFWSMSLWITTLKS